MKKTQPCAVCGEKTTEFLFSDRWLGIPLCSRNCENEYFRTLAPAKKEQMDRLQKIYDLMRIAKRRETICWAAAGLGLLMIGVAFLSINAALFLVGTVPLTCGAVATSYFEKYIGKLRIQRKQIMV